MLQFTKKPWLIAACVTVVLTLQFLLVPLVVSFMNSPDITGLPEQGGQATPTSNAATQDAYLACNEHIRRSLPDANEALFPDLPIKTWDIGFGRYIVTSQIRFPSFSANKTKYFVCRVQMGNEGKASPSTWQVVGVQLSDTPTQ